jgi:hypothetical protein
MPKKKPVKKHPKISEQPKEVIVYQWNERETGEGERVRGKGEEDRGRRSEVSKTSDEI